MVWRKDGCPEGGGEAGGMAGVFVHAPAVASALALIFMISFQFESLGTSTGVHQHPPAFAGG